MKMENGTTNNGLMCFLSTSALHWVPSSSIFAKAVCGCPNYQQHGCNGPGLLPVLIPFRAPREHPSSLIPVLPKLYASNESQERRLHVWFGYTYFHWSESCQWANVVTIGLMTIGFINDQLLREKTTDEQLISPPVFGRVFPTGQIYFGFLFPLWKVSTGLKPEVVILWDHLKCNVFPVERMEKATTRIEGFFHPTQKLSMSAVVAPHSMWFQFIFCSFSFLYFGNLGLWLMVC